MLSIATIGAVFVLYLFCDSEDSLVNCIDVYGVLDGVRIVQCCAQATTLQRMNDWLSYVLDHQQIRAAVQVTEQEVQLHVFRLGRHQRLPYRPSPILPIAADLFHDYAVT